MSRSKSVAFMLLLGAVFLGGVLGFTVDRVMRPDVRCEERMDRETARARFADEVGLDAEQRVRMNQLLDARNARLDSVYATIRPATRAIHEQAREEFRAMLTPEQLVRWEAMRKRDEERRGGEDRRRERD